jgi:N-acetylmuramoyl-L-alanine amidase
MEGTRLLLDMPGVVIAESLRKPVQAKEGLFAGAAAEAGPKGTQLRIDFRERPRFAVRLAENPWRLIVSASAEVETVPVAPVRKSLSGRVLSSMAEQLGLGVGTVFIDAGHGGKDLGTSHNGIRESDVCLDVALELGRILKGAGIDVVHTRTGNVTVPLLKRASLANGTSADIFVSIHVNAFQQPAVQGVETYYLDFASSAHSAKVAARENAGMDRRLADMEKILTTVLLTSRAEESRKLARSVQRRLVGAVRERDFAVRDNGVRSAPFLVLLDAQMPAVLVELGYCTNPGEAGRLRTPAYRSALAQGLANGILEYRRKLSGGSMAQAKSAD